MGFLIKCKSNSKKAIIKVSIQNVKLNETG